MFAGAQLRTWRRYQGLTQAKLADLTEVDQATISRWERGVVRPSIELQRHLQGVMGYDDRSFLTDQAVIGMIELLPMDAFAINSSCELSYVSNVIRKTFREAGVSLDELQQQVLREERESTTWSRMSRVLELGNCYITVEGSSIVRPGMRYVSRCTAISLMDEIHVLQCLYDVKPDETPGITKFGPVVRL